MSFSVAPDGQCPVVLYAAKSTEDSRGSIPDQLAVLRTAVEAEGGRAVVGEHHDEAASAYHGSRGPGLAAALADAERLAAARGACELWVIHSDRMARGDARTGAHLAEYAIWARKTGVTLRALEDPDTFRDLVYAVLMGERNYEDSARKAKATQAGLRRAAERGDMHGQVPDGYRVLRSVDDHGRVSRRVELDPDRAPVLRLIFDRALEGWTDRAIVLELDRYGHRTAPKRQDRKPRPFDANRIRQTLTNPTYAALRVYRGEVLGPGNWPGFITEEDFYRLRQMRAARGRTDREPVGRPPIGYVLARVGSCGECGSPMDVVTGRHLRKDGTRKRTYTCRAHRERPQDCSAKPIPADVVDHAFVANLTSFLGDVESWRGRLVQSREADRARMRGEVDRATTDLETLERTVDRIGANYAAHVERGEDEDADAVREVLKRKRAERDGAERRLQAARAALEDAHGDGDDVDPLLDFYNGLSAELTGRVDSARGDVKRLNAVVREFFADVALRKTAYGVEVAPVLSPVASARIAEAVLHRGGEWPAGVEWHADPQRLAEHADDPTLAVVLDRAVRAGRALDGGDHDEAERIVAEPALTPRNPTVIATGREKITPPLRAIHAPQVPDVNSQPAW